MPRNSTFVIVGTATLDQVNLLVKQGMSRDKAKMYSTEQAARRLRDLANKGKRKQRKKPDAKRTSQSKLLVKNIWPRITSLVQEQPTKCWVAVAFFANNASKQLPLKMGSTLVVNTAEKTLNAGLTNPFELEKLINNGVDVYGNDKLHAKVFVFPGSAIIGSTNASRTSANRWIEAAVEIADKGTVIKCRQFVKSLCHSPLIGPERLEQLKALYHPPSADGLPGASKSKDEPTGTPEQLWLVKTEPTEYDKHDKLAEARGMPHAEEKLSEGSEGRFSVDSFCVSDSNFLRKVAEGDSVSLIMHEDRELVAHPPSCVLHFEPYTKDDGSEWIMVFVEACDDKFPQNLDAIIFELEKRFQSCRSFRTIRHSKRVSDRRLAEAFQTFGW